MKKGGLNMKDTQVYF